MSYNPYIDMYEGYIYCIKNLINNKIYIGQTRRTVEHRFGQHKTGKYKDISCVVDYAIRKYGADSFNIETIGIYKRKTEKELKEILNSRERFYIEYYNTCIINGGYGYNIDEGGNSHNYCAKMVDVYDIDGNYVETCKSGILTADKYNINICSVYDNCNGKTTKILNCDFYFRYHGDDFWKYHPYQCDNQYDIYQFSMNNGRLINHFYTLHDAAYFIDKDNVDAASSAICSVVNSDNRYSTYGYFWSKKDKLDFDINDYKNRLPIDQYSVDGELMCSHNSITDALSSIGVRKDQMSGIRKQCKGETFYPALGYIWRYHGDPFDKYDVIKQYPRSKKQIVQYSLDGSYLRTYNSVSEACMSIGISTTSVRNITEVCDGLSEYAHGYVWRWPGDAYTPPKPPKNFRAMNCYDLNYNFIKTYNSSSEAAKSVVPNSNNYHSVANNIRTAAKNNKTARGYRWYYADDPMQPDKSRIVA